MVRSWTGDRVFEVEIHGVTEAMLQSSPKDVECHASIEKVTYETRWAMEEDEPKETVKEIARWVLGAELT
jgi:hypothetical protein